MTRTPEELLALIVKPSREAGEQDASAALLAHARERADVIKWSDELQGHLPATGDEELREYYQAALLGVCAGLAERGLSPYLEEHVAIIPPLLEEIHSVYSQVKEAGSDYDRADFTHRAFEYGIHKATYLDWDLYGSKTLY